MASTDLDAPTPQIPCPLDLEKKRRKGRRKLALNLPDASELVVSNANDFLAKILAPSAGIENRVLRGGGVTECYLAFLLKKLKMFGVGSKVVAVGELHWSFACCFRKPSKGKDYAFPDGRRTRATQL